VSQPSHIVVHLAVVAGISFASAFASGDGQKPRVAQMLLPLRVIVPQGRESLQG
jgi:hypothetical protein